MLLSKGKLARNMFGIYLYDLNRSQRKKFEVAWAEEVKKQSEKDSKRSKTKLIDYPRFIKIARTTSFIGTFPIACMTEEGKRILKESVLFVGKKPTYRGASAKGMYFKYALDKTIDSVNISVFRDWIIEQGYEAVIKKMKGRKGGKTQNYITLVIKG
jgi:hypothetical protein